MRHGKFVDMRWIAQRMRHRDDRINRLLAKERAHVMTQALTTMTPTNEPPSPETMSKVLLGGDLAQLTPAQQLSYYRAVCESVGLNPLTKPFEFLRLSGRLVLYALRNATDQIRHKYAISVQIVAREVVEDCYVVTARATLPSGRHDEAIGAVPIAGLKGEARSNAMMKCETKSKRRVTLSLVGLSTLDESEVESIPGAQPVPFNPETVNTSPAPARVTARAESSPPAIEPPDRAAPADLNHAIPETWKPFVEEPDRLRGRIVSLETENKAGRRSGSNYTKTTITLDSGETASTLNLELGATALACKAAGSLVEITTEATRWGQNIKTIARVPDEGDDAAAL